MARKRINPNDIELNYEQNTERYDKKRRESEENAEKTNLSISPERKERQNKYKLTKEEATKRIEKLEKLIETLKKDLETKLITLSNEFGATSSVKAVKEELKELKSCSDELVELSKLFGKEPAYEYNALLLKLASNVNPEFSLYANYEKSLNLTMLSKAVKSIEGKNKKTLKNKLEKIGFFEDVSGNISSEICKYFPEYINKLTDISQVCFTLTLDPSKFEKVNPNIKTTLLEHPEYLMKVINTNPEILTYLPNDYLDNLTKNHANYVGKMIVKTPEVLTQFYPAFFDDRHHQKDIKYIFGGIKKDKIVEAITPYVWKFPELKAHFKIETANSELEL